MVSSLEIILGVDPEMLTELEKGNLQGCCDGVMWWVLLPAPQCPFIINSILHTVQTKGQGLRSVHPPSLRKRLHSLLGDFCTSILQMFCFFPCTL